MAQVTVSISEVKDGSMYAPEDQSNRAIRVNRESWLAQVGSSSSTATRLYVSYDGDDFCRYRIVGASHMGEGMNDGEGECADALVTVNSGQTLFLPIADCVGTVLFDKKQGVLMLSHLGRHSLEQDGGVRSVEFLVDQFGSDPATLQVWLAPAPGKESYQIFKLGNQGMKEAVFEQLQRAGVLKENIIDNPADTATDDRYFSYSEFIKGNKPLEGRFAIAATML